MFVVLIVEGLFSGASVLAVIPLADYMLDPELKNPNSISRFFIVLLESLEISPSFYIFSIIFFFTNLLKSATDVIVRYSILSIKYSVQGGIFNDVITAFFSSKWTFFSNTDQGKLLNSFSRELGNVGDAMAAACTQLARVIQLLIYIAIPLFINPIMTAIALLIVFLLGTPILLFGKYAYALGRESMHSGNVFMGALHEQLSAARLVMSFGQNHKAKDLLRLRFWSHVKATIRSQVFDSALTSSYQPTAILAAIISLIVGINYGLNIAELVGLLWALLRALPVLSQVMSANPLIKNLLPSYDQLMGLKSEAKLYEERIGRLPFEKFKSSIELKNITFYYDKNIDVLKGVNLVIGGGGITAIVGGSGSGKSTIIDILLGLQVPSSGSILIDGVDLSDYDLNTFRHQVGYVPQDPFLFKGSIRDNLLWAKPEATQESLWDSLRLANAEKFVRESKDGLDTIVGERGLKMSGGQRQRIALARALIRNPQLLILDEATSALDLESDTLIQRSIEEVSKYTSIVLVTHRLRALEGSKIIYVLKDGVIVEHGEYNELSEKIGGELYKIIHSQVVH